MSYTRVVKSQVHYEGRVHYSGSVSYPASQSGGTKHYSGTEYYSGQVPITINVHVDTSPFDSSVSNCNGSLNILGSSVVAMNSSQCAQIKESSNKIASSIVGGFFNLIKSEISQALAGLISKINSSIMLIKTHAMRIIEQQKTMQQDYARLSAHYVQVFNELDKECQRRIVTLDKRAFALAINVMKKQYITPYLENVGKNFTYLLEEPFAKNKLVSARLKQKTYNIISALAQNITQDKIYSRTLLSVLRDEAIAEKCDFFLPVLHAENIDIESGKIKEVNYFAKEAGDSSINKINDAINEYFDANNIEWKEIDALQAEKISHAFNALLQEEVDERLIATIKELKSKNSMLCN